MATLLAIAPAGDGVVLELSLQADGVELASVSRNDDARRLDRPGAPAARLEARRRSLRTVGRVLRLRTLPFPADTGLREVLAQLRARPCRGRGSPSSRVCTCRSTCTPSACCCSSACSATPRALPAAVGAAVGEVRQRLLQRGRNLGEDGGDALVAEAVDALSVDAFGKSHLFADPEAHEAAASALPDTLGSMPS